jgi:demethylmenaquinone methyltransferase/2-methoxy-6-polyprenyl-1,4-benzoquinol methylase/phosphoethanolamine N-methyltransferase
MKNHSVESNNFDSRISKELSHAAPETEGITIRWAALYDFFVALLLRLIGEKTSFEAATLEQAQLSPGNKVLDVGCGTGTLAIAAKAQVGPDGKVHGIDAAPEMIAVARRKAVKFGDAGMDLDFQVGLIEDIPFPDDQFDIVVSSLMIHHLPGDDLKRRGFAEICRVLKPGGRLLVVDFEPPTDGLLKPLMSHVLGHRMMENDVRRLPAMVEAAGFTEVKVGRTSHRMLSFVRGRAGKGQNGRS